MMTNQPSKPSSRTWLTLACLLATAATTTGCKTTTSRFEILDYMPTGQVRQYHETFEESWYTMAPDGNTSIVLVRKEPTTEDTREAITQVIRMKTFWRCLPGKTVAHSTQINATISYIIMGPNGGTAYEGTGSVFFDENKDGDEIEGALHLARLRPVRQVDGGQPLFDKAQLSGKFIAKRDSRRVVKIMNETDRQFGPLPNKISPRKVSSTEQR